MMEKMSHTISNLIFPVRCGFGIGYGIGRKYQPVWVSVSVLDLNQNSGFDCTLMPSELVRMKKEKWFSRSLYHSLHAGTNPQIIVNLSPSQNQFS